MPQVVTLVKEDTRHIDRVLVSSLIALAAIAVAMYVYRGEKYAVIAPAGLVFLVWAAWRVWMAPALVITYIIAVSRNIQELEFPVFFHPLTLVPALIIMALLLRAERILHPAKSIRSDHKPDVMGSVVAALLLWIGFIYLYGMAAGNDTRFVFYELSYIAMYASYFFWRALFRHHGHIINWSWLLLGAGIIAGLELFLYITMTFTDIINFVMHRTLNRQPQILLLSVPLAFTFFLTRKKLLTRVFGAILLLITLMHTFLSQQRSVWLGVAIVSIIYFTLYFFRDGLVTKKIVIWCLVMFFAVLLGFTVLLSASLIMGTDMDTLLTRWDDVQSLQDDSFQIRVFDLKTAISNVGNNWIAGKGGGKLNNWIHSGWNFYYFDISYGVAYYKGGIPLLLLILLVYITSFRKSYKLYRSNAELKYRLLGITFVSTLGGLFFVSWFNCGLLFYRFIMVWMMITAMSTVLLEKLETNRVIDSEAL